jgi:hypothetical protein
MRHTCDTNAQVLTEALIRTCNSGSGTQGARRLTCDTKTLQAFHALTATRLLW